MCLCFCHASGTISSTASCSVRPVISKNSSALSKLPESEHSGSMIGYSFCKSSASKSLSNVPCRERMAFTLPRSVLISPLWLMNRKGCARSQLGKVFVEKRECTIARCVAKSSRARSV